MCLEISLLFQRKQDSRMNLLDCHICKRKNNTFFFCVACKIFIRGVVVAVKVMFHGFFSIHNYEHHSNFIFHFLILLQWWILWESHKAKQKETKTRWCAIMHGVSSLARWDWWTCLWLMYYSPLLTRNEMSCISTYTLLFLICQLSLDRTENQCHSIRLYLLFYKCGPWLVYLWWNTSHWIISWQMRTGLLGLKNKWHTESN